MLATMLRRAAALLILLAAGAVAPVRADDASVTVYAAASLKNALDAVAAQWQRETGKRVVFSYAASSALAKQIEAAAPADVFISADLEWMDYLAQRTLIDDASRVRLLGNALVLVAPKTSTLALKIAPGFALAPALADGRLAVADVNAVPAGKYAKAALEKLGVWADVATKLAQAENVRAALALVSRGEVPLGIVYRTDANADAGVKVIDTFPDGSHPPIVYPAAVLARSTNPEARAFLAYLRSAQAKALFEQQGFTVLP